MRKHITQAVAKNAKPADKPYQIHDTLIRGFVLRIQPSGTKTWKLVINRKPTTLGSYPAMTVAMAEAKAKRILSDEADMPTGKVMTLEQFLNEYYAEWLETHSARPTEILSIIRRFGFSNRPLDEIGIADVERWRNRQTNKPRTINRQTAILKACLQRAVKWKVIRKNPLDGLETMKVDRVAVTRYLSDEESLRLDKALVDASPWLRTFTIVALNTGARRGELWQLKWGDINRGMMTIHGHGAKSGQTRHIPLNQTARDALKAWRGDVIPMPDVEVFGHKWLDRSWQTLMKRAGIESFRFHDTRHTFASRLVMSGTPLNTVRELLGHSSIEMTLRYAHLSEESLKSAVDAIG